MKTTLQRLVTTIIMLIVAYNYASAQCYPCTGSPNEGSPVITSNQALNGDHYYDNFTIAAGVAVSVTTGTLIIHATGNVSIIGTINAVGQGGNGGNGGSGFSPGINGMGIGGGNGGCANSGSGGGAGYSASGNGGCNAAVPAYGGADVLGLFNGSGGGGGGGSFSFPTNHVGANGGNGGGSIAIIACGTITISGTLSAAGNIGGFSNQAGHGGGGSGGTIYLQSGQNSVTNSGIITVAGGAGGGASGNDGSLGRIRIDAIVTNSGTITGSIYNPQNFDNTVAAVVPTEPSCHGGANGKDSVGLVQPGINYTYLWSTNATSQSISGLAAGIYTVTVTNTNGCSKIMTSTVSEPADITANITTTPTTSNTGTATVTPTGGTSPYSYQWSNGQIGSTTSGLTVGTYQMTVTDAHNCTKVTPFNITSNAGIEDHINDLSVSIVPNPASSSLRILATGALHSNSFHIFNCAGSEVLNGKIENASTAVDITKLPQGAYLIKIDKGYHKLFLISRE